jgi:hypothetical protein
MMPVAPASDLASGRALHFFAQWHHEAPKHASRKCFCRSGFSLFPGHGPALPVQAAPERGGGRNWCSAHGRGATGAAVGPGWDACNDTLRLTGWTERWRAIVMRRVRKTDRVVKAKRGGRAKGLGAD